MFDTCLTLFQDMLDTHLCPRVRLKVAPQLFAGSDNKPIAADLSDRYACSVLS